MQIPGARRSEQSTEDAIIADQMSQIREAICEEYGKKVMKI